MLHHPPTAAASARVVAPKKRGSYNCGRCGLPKKGHVCPSADGGSASLHLPRSGNRLRRALSFDEDRPSSSPVPALEDEDEGVIESAALVTVEEPEVVVEEGGGEEEDDEAGWDGEGSLPSSCMVEILRRLSPKELMRAAAVCRGWRECVRKVWRSAEELRLRVSPRSQIGIVGSVLQKCAGLTRLALRMERSKPTCEGNHDIGRSELDVDATMLACVAFSLPNLEAFEINMAENAVNRITGDELGRFVAEKRCLSTLKVEGCTNIGFLSISSSSLSTLWLSNLYCISKMVFKCPNLRELSLDFTRQQNDSTDLITMMECLGRTCPRLRNIHVASIHLSNEAVLSLTSANLRDLRMLSLVLGSGITDAAVTAIVSCCTNLELLDLSGSSITDSGIRMICNVFPETLSRLLLALCPNITSNGVQFAAVQLPLLQLIDCGMSICDTDNQNESAEKNVYPNNERSGEYTKCQKLSTMKSQKIYQKLIIKHGTLRKLSLWGCSGLDVLNEFAAAVKDHLPCKRLADGSKRVQVPHFVQQLSDDEKQKRKRMTQCIVHQD
ncbi:F-box LRR-repeat protein [Musa troglodytarum]|uniref:F-box LRR-repeat protein n=1 Tax=Musa troglodytarum TaxID=320322 RepID=A0A9E7F840_9LILI|nr:F-box LRR-repeat protein [Musa troglodytarum]